MFAVDSASATGCTRRTPTRLSDGLVRRGMFEQTMWRMVSLTKPPAGRWLGAAAEQQGGVLSTTTSGRAAAFQRVSRARTRPGRLQRNNQARCCGWAAHSGDDAG